MPILFLLVYLLFCFLVAFAARHTRLGFIGILLLSVIITPLLTAILAILFANTKAFRKSG